MTVAQLIEKLKGMPQDMEVYDWNYYPVEEPIIKTIELWATGLDVEEKTVVFFSIVYFYKYIVNLRNRDREM